LSGWREGQSFPPSLSSDWRRIDAKRLLYFRRLNSNFLSLLSWKLQSLILLKIPLKLVSLKISYSNEKDFLFCLSLSFSLSVCIIWFLSYLLLFSIDYFLYHFNYYRHQPLSIGKFLHFDNCFCQNEVRVLSA